MREWKLYNTSPTKEEILKGSKVIECSHCGNRFTAAKSVYDEDKDEYIVEGVCPKCLWTNQRRRLFLCARKKCGI